MCLLLVSVTAAQVWARAIFTSRDPLARQGALRLDACDTVKVTRSHSRLVYIYACDGCGCGEKFLDCQQTWKVRRWQTVEDMHPDDSTFITSFLWV
eukprot:3009684-Pleurochrysis_carterae.AAC.4